jgi:hypothetical protein
MEKPLEFSDTTRRDVLRKAVFITPVILSLPVNPSFAQVGSDLFDPPDLRRQNIGGDSESQQRGRRRHHWWFFNW